MLPVVLAIVVAGNLLDGLSHVCFGEKNKNNGLISIELNQEVQVGSP